VPPACWATLDYAVIESPDICGEATWTMARAGTGHGLLVWYDAVLADGVGFSNAPNAPELIFGAAFFPWASSVRLADGDGVTVALYADLVGNDYVYRWNSRVLDQGDPGRIKADFRQSSFFSMPLAPARLQKQAARHVPVLDEEGLIDRQILTLMDGTMALEEIAQRIRDLFPSRFSSTREALTHVGELSQKYSR
jgi:protein arginine N-methyltransferase 1